MDLDQLKQIWEVLMNGTTIQDAELAKEVWQEIKEREEIRDLILDRVHEQVAG